MFKTHSKSQDDLVNRFFFVKMTNEIKNIENEILFKLSILSFPNLKFLWKQADSFDSIESTNQVCWLTHHYFF